MKGGIGGIIVGLLLMVGCGHALSESLKSVPAVKDPTPQTYIQTIPQAEDDPGWDCHTMGNKQCGPKEAK